MKIVLGVSGSVAAYRAADLARELMRSGFQVRVCLTDAAQNFVTPALFEALTGQPCLIDTFEEPITGRMAHIDWAREADAVLIAPATANTINKLANGIGDDMLTTIALATTRPLLIAPAMNPAMYAHTNTQSAIQALTDRGVTIIEPTEGDVACGENGQGKLASVGEIVAATLGRVDIAQLFAGKKILITSGPTQEPIDSVRFLSNRSSGKMGSALASAALMMGADVTVIAGPQKARIPSQAKYVPVVTAEQMLEAALKHAPTSDLIIGAAAVADYRPQNPVLGKLRRTEAAMDLPLVANPDVIATVAHANPNIPTIGFAAEPDTSVEVASEKLKRKGLLGIAVNDVSRPTIGFDSENNQIRLLSRSGHSTESPLASKLVVAQWLLKEIDRLIRTN